MHEIELKFQVPSDRRAQVDAAVAGRAQGARTRLRAAYVDTADRALAAAGLALRLRREGRRWVQTLKGRTADTMARLEHNVARGSSGAMPDIDPSLHAGTPVSDGMRAALSRGAGGPLGVRYSTDILRRARTVRVPGGQVELAFDVGQIRAGGRVIEVSEFEIELLSGSPRAVLDTARLWVQRYGLWLDVRSKAERGDLLARGETVAAPLRAADPVLTHEMSGALAWRRVLAACADQIIGNASQIASGAHSPEHVHQLRVGLRRLRSALSLFDGEGADAALVEPAAALFRELGNARDAAVMQSEFGVELAAALQREGMEQDVALPVAATASESPAVRLRKADSQRFLLGLLAALQAPLIDTEDSSSLQVRLARRLDRWHRGVLRDAADFAQLDDAAVHRLRKRAKRLRYGAEFAGSLFDPRALRRYLRAMDALQERLGAITDVLMVARAFRETTDDHVHRRFALGWLAARRESLMRGAGPELKAFAKVRRFWEA